MWTSRTLANVCSVLSLLLALPAGATISPQARAVLDRFVEASGGRAAWEKSRAEHSRASLSTSGLKGTIESWREAPDQRASEIALGPLTIRDWTSGARSSRIDPSGKLQTLDGKDLEEAIAGTWFENQRWLEPDQGGGDVSATGEVTDSLGTFAVLEVKPPAGQARRLEFDIKTGLLVRVLSKHDQMTVVTTNSDYRRVDGLMVPFRTVQQVGDNTVIVQAEQVDFPARIPDARFVPPSSPGAPAVTWLKTAGSARLPFEYRSHHVWLRAAVNGGPPANFIFDTGAGITVIDSAYASYVGLMSAGKLQAQGGGATGNASFATVDTLRVVAGDDGIELRDVKVAVVNVSSDLAPFFWRDCAGIIGFNVIGQFVTRVDYDDRLVSLFDPKAFTHDGKGSAIPMTLAGNVPVVHIKVDGAFEGEARVDIGSPAMLDLHTPFVKKNDLLSKVRNSVATTAGSIGGTFESRLARMNSIEIGPYRIADPIVGLSTVDRGLLASEDYAGNVGNELLDRFTITLDYERRQIWLEPGAGYRERQSFSRLGAGFVKYGDEVRALQVIPGSPAAVAGLKDGDVVKTVNGRLASALDPDELQRQFEHDKPGTKVTLVVMHEGRPTTHTVKLRDIL